MSLSNYAENSLLDTLLAGTKYVKLHTGDPGEDCTSNPATHTTRAAVTHAAASGGSKASNADATFTPLAATETVSYFSIWDAVSGGNPLISGPLDTSHNLDAGGSFVIPSGQLISSLN